MPLTLDASVLRSYARRAENDLKGNILPFWLRHTRDRQHGGFFGEIDTVLTVRADAPRGALLTSRILWTFAAAARRYPDASYREMARWAFNDLVARFWDDKHGGLFWMVSADGKVLRDRKQIYGQAFGIYALTEYFQLTGENEALDRALELYRLIEKHARERVHGGYLEAFKRDWTRENDVRLSVVDMNEPKSQNTHLHVMEAYTNLLRVWPQPELREAQHALIGIMIGPILDKSGRHLGLFFDETWNPRADRISFGHDIEASWLLTEAAGVLGDAALLERVKAIALTMASATLEEGVDVDGAIYNEATPAGLSDTDKEWWPQAEAAVGFLNAYQLDGDERFLRAALASWDFIEAHLVDRAGGEWHRAVTRDRHVKTEHPKVSFWKCPYHNGRACLELVERLRGLAARMEPEPEPST
jgi:cellobiose epimerase